MKLLLLLGLLCVNAFSQEFLMGKENPWGVVIAPYKESPTVFRIGARLQTEFIYQQNETEDKSYDSFDFYLRRSRFQFQAVTKNGYKFKMDVRNDGANKKDKGESDFNIGDAYLEKKLSNNLMVRAFRAKVDLSRSETVSSANLMYLDRASIADEAAQYVNHNRRATNIQLLGTYDKWSFQAVIGDGVQAGKFHDAKGDTLDGSIEYQKPMSGAKLRFYPVKGWEDKKLTETYFGQGQHFSFGVGYFQTSDIQYVAENYNASVNRELLNFEVSAHYHKFSFQAEYFHFSGIVEDLSASSQNLGSSQGHYFQLEYLLSEKYFLSPFVRLESWNKFLQESDSQDYHFSSNVLGVNWYLRGNNMRVALVYQEDQYGDSILETDKLGNSFDKVNKLKLISMWHF